MANKMLQVIEDLLNEYLTGRAEIYNIEYKREGKD